MQTMFETARAGEETALLVNGDVDAYTSPDLRRAILDLADTGVRRILVDLRRAGFLESTGLGVLVGCRASLAARGIDLIVQPRSDQMARLLRMAELRMVVA